MKIAIAGCAGMGKTVLAKMLAQRLGMDVITGSAQTVLSKHGYSPYAHSRVESFIEERGLRQKIFDAQKKAEDDHDSFVTDRAHVEQAAYAIVEAQEHSEATENLISMCANEMMKYNVVIYLPFSGGQTRDMYYRLTVDSVIRRLFVDWVDNGVFYMTVSPKKLEMALNNSDLGPIADEVAELVSKALELTLPKKRSQRVASPHAASQERVRGPRRKARQKRAGR